MLATIVLMLVYPMRRFYSSPFSGNQERQARDPATTSISVNRAVDGVPLPPHQRNPPHADRTEVFDNSA